MAGQVVEVRLPNDTVAFVRVADVDDGGAEKVGWQDRFEFDDVAGTLEGFSMAIRSALRLAAPSRVTVELGLELAVKAGRLTGLLVDGSGKGSLRVTLEWHGEPPGEP